MHRLHRCFLWLRAHLSRTSTNPISVLYVLKPCLRRQARSCAVVSSTRQETAVCSQKHAARIGLRLGSIQCARMDWRASAAAAQATLTSHAIHREGTTLRAGTQPLATRWARTSCLSRLPSPFASSAASSSFVSSPSPSRSRAAKTVSQICASEKNRVGRHTNHHTESAPSQRERGMNGPRRPSRGGPEAPVRLRISSDSSGTQGRAPGSWAAPPTGVCANVPHAN